MGNATRCKLAAAGLSSLIGLSTAIGAEGPNIENGVGILCESPQQVEELLRLAIDTESAVAQVNAQSKSRVCEIRNIAFLVGGVVAESSNDKGKWEIRKVLVVGLIVGRTMSPVQPYQKYTAFIVSKASPS